MRLLQGVRHPLRSCLPQRSRYGLLLGEASGLLLQKTLKRHHAQKLDLKEIRTYKIQMLNLFTIFGTRYLNPTRPLMREASVEVSAVHNTLKNMLNER